MRKLWQVVETILANSRLRLPVYVITIIFGVGVFIAPNIFWATIFVALLGFTLIIESIRPRGYPLLYKFLTDLFPSKIQITIVILLQILGIILGLFLMFIGIGVEIGRYFP